jgi:hypothetical protein
MSAAHDCGASMTVPFDADREKDPVVLAVLAFGFH